MHALQGGGLIVTPVDFPDGMEELQRGPEQRLKLPKCKGVALFEVRAAGLDRVGWAGGARTHQQWPGFRWTTAVTRVAVGCSSFCVVRLLRGTYCLILITYCV